MKKLCVINVIALLVATACGGGSGGSEALNPVAGPAATAPGATIQGRITGFGSVFIDGERFTTDRATFTKDDDSASQGDLREGMKVTIRGDLAQHRADEVRFDEDVKGPVDEVNGDSLVVLGQTVHIVATTRLDDVNQPIQVGDILEVSGFRDENDALEASFIEGKDAAEVDEFEVMGAIRNVDTTNDSFTIGALTIDYTNARLDDLSEAALVDGLIVEAEDANKAYSPGDFTLAATKVEPKGPLHDTPANAEVEIEGIISELVGNDGFRIAGVEVRFTSTTEFQFATAADLAPGAKVNVKGRLDANDVVQATRIKFQHNVARLDGIVEAVDASASMIRVFGVDISVTEETRTEDDRDGEGPFSIADLNAGDFVEVEGVASNERIIATRLERDEVDDTRLRGPARNVDAARSTLTVLGVEIVTDDNTEFEADGVTTAAAFFAQLIDGQSIVDADWEGSVTDPSVAVHELELED